MAEGEKSVSWFDLVSGSLVPVLCDIARMNVRYSTVFTVLLSSWLPVGLQLPSRRRPSTCTMCPEQQPVKEIAEVVLFPPTPMSVSDNYVPSFALLEMRVK